MVAKALILANIGNSHYDGEKMIPSCLLKVFNEMTIIERQVSLLNINGFSKKEICILCGVGGVWTEEVTTKIEQIGTKILRCEKENQLKKQMFDDEFFDDTEELLILEGNMVLDIGIISRLRRYHKKNVMVVNELLNPDKEKSLIIEKEGKICSVKNSAETNYPWVEFSGIMKITAETLSAFKKSLTCNRYLLDLIEDSLDKIDFSTIKYDDLIYGRLNGGYSEELTGGSYSKLNYRLVVKKNSDNEGRDKLINEIEWLLSIPKELKPYFSEVLEYDISSPDVYYNVPYYGSRNLRERIFDGHFDANGACEFLEHLLDWMFENVYCRKISDAPESWVMEKHINRVLDRLPECKVKCDVLGRIIDADKVIVNGIEYRNVKEIYTELSKNGKFLKTVNPKELVMIHGDLHFQNILVTNETDTGFILVDPRGEKNGSDIYYDLGKVWHSFHAKYDFIHTDQFEFDIRWENGVPITEYRITNDYIMNVYEEMHQKFNKIILKYPFINKDPYWEMKILFAEASHLCSVATFHIGKTEDYRRPTVLYLIGVQLANEFYDRFIKGNEQFD